MLVVFPSTSISWKIAGAIDYILFILYINGYYYIFLAYTNVCSVTELT